MRRGLLRKVVMLALVLALGGCAAGISLHTQSVEGQLAPGSYTAILYGAKFEDDFETVAFLDVDGDEYRLEVAGSVKNYATLKNLGGFQAFNDAKRFVSFHRAFHSLAQREIRTPEGTVVGYALVPLYRVTEFDTDEPVEIVYRLQDDKVVKIYVRLKESVENLMYYHGP